MRFSTVFVVAASAAVASAASLTERGFFHHFKPHKPVYHTIVVGDAKGDTIYTPPVVVSVCFSRAPSHHLIRSPVCE